MATQNVILWHLNTKMRHPETTPDADEDNTTKPPILFLLYVQGLSEKIQIACYKLGIRMVFKSSEALRQTLTRVKSRMPELKEDIVYKIPCCDCEAQYIGETRRSLQKRIAEHKYNPMTGRMALKVYQTETSRFVLNSIQVYT